MGQERYSRICPYDSAEAACFVARAIYQSLKRRRERLESRLREEEAPEERRAIRY